MNRFKIDENLPVEVADILRNAGHDATTVPEQLMGGRPDPDLAAVCQHESRVLLTLDLDFADIRTYPPNSYPGIIVFRLSRLDKPNILSATTRLVLLLGTEPTQGKLWIVDETRVRIRA